MLKEHGNMYLYGGIYMLTRFMKLHDRTNLECIPSIFINGTILTEHSSLVVSETKSINSLPKEQNAHNMYW